MSDQATNGEVVFNKLNVALEKSRRVLESWLPASLDSDADQAKTEAEFEEEDAELFKPMPALAGLGASIPNNVEEGDFRRQELSSNARLRAQLLGEDMKKHGLQGKAKSKRALPIGIGSKPQSVTAKVIVQDESEEEGRSGLGNSKKKRKVTEQKSDSAQKSKGDESEDGFKSSRPTKRPANYLDEVLQAKASKKKKKRKNKAEGS